ncbi:hypothetical protein HGRIS_007863 [Hohenbuehelia grisea]|uniref:Uncharacterized protein n=1 Tax=Hohenbuehelia grisea TaxID=104357 RepID=A0ABR3J6K4_9AGAR
MPYYQVSHLQALTQYFEALGISDVSELQLGTGTPPSEDPQVFSGFVSIFADEILPISYINHPPLPSSFPHRLRRYKVIRSFPLPSSIAMTDTDKPDTPTDGFRFLKHLGKNKYSLTDPIDDTVTSYRLSQIKEYIAFSNRLRNAPIEPGTAAPGGYYAFAQAYNLEPNIVHKFCVFNSNKQLISYPALESITDVVPNHAEAAAMSKPITKAKPYDRPPPKTIPSVDNPTLSLPTEHSALFQIEPRHQKIVNNMLWEKVERSLRQDQYHAQKRDSAIRSRNAKRTSAQAGVAAASSSISSTKSNPASKMDAPMVVDKDPTASSSNEMSAN